MHVLIGAVILVELHDDQTTSSLTYNDIISLQFNVYGNCFSESVIISCVVVRFTGIVRFTIT